MVDEGDLAIAKAGPAQIGTQEQFERTILVRGVNTLKAARVVAEMGHWEVAAVCARQIFELVLNMEEIDRAQDRVQASMRFALYGLLQKARYQKVELDYDRDTGRPYDAQRFEELPKMLASPIFDPFRVKKAGKPDGWLASWSGKSAWQLAQASTSRMRVPQYNLLFKKWSEQVHGAPGAHVDNMFRQGDADWIAESIKQDDNETSNVMHMAMLLFVELWHLLPGAAPFPAEKALDWSNRLFAWIERDGKIPAEYRYPRNPDGSYIIEPL